MRTIKFKFKKICPYKLITAEFFSVIVIGLVVTPNGKLETPKLVLLSMNEYKINHSK